MTPPPQPLSHTALLVVDSQRGALSGDFWGTSRSNPAYESNISTLLAAFRAHPQTHIIHITHQSLNPLSPLYPSKPTSGFAECSLPLLHEEVFMKSTSDAFAARGQTGLREYLAEKDIRKVVFCGVAVDLCLGSTVRGASDAGVGDYVLGGENVKGDLVLVGDAVAAWKKHGGVFDAEVVHGVHVESLKGEYVRVVATEDVVKELVEGSKI